ncbi:unnamed protein product, partial [Owenia fusiformis]
LRQKFSKNGDKNELSKSKKQKTQYKVKRRSNAGKYGKIRATRQMRVMVVRLNQEDFNLNQRNKIPDIAVEKREHIHHRTLSDNGEPSEHAMANEVPSLRDQMMRNNNGRPKRNNIQLNQTNKKHGINSQQKHSHHKDSDRTNTQNANDIKNKTLQQTQIGNREEQLTERETKVNDDDQIGIETKAGLQSTKLMEVMNEAVYDFSDEDNLEGPIIREGLMKKIRTGGRRPCYMPTVSCSNVTSTDTTTTVKSNAKEANTSEGEEEGLLDNIVRNETEISKIVTVNSDNEDVDEGVMDFTEDE